MKSKLVIFAICAVSVLPSAASAQLFRGQLIRSLFGNDAPAQRTPANRPDNKKAKKPETANSKNSNTNAVPKSLQQNPNSRQQPQPPRLPPSVPHASGPVANDVLGIVISPNKDRHFISRISPNGYGAKSGLKMDDEILEVGGLPLQGTVELAEIFKVLNEGDQLVFVIRRQGKKEEVVVSFGASQAPAKDDVIQPVSGASANDNEIAIPEADEHPVPTPAIPSPSDNQDHSQLEQLRAIINQQQDEIVRLKSEISDLKNVAGIEETDFQLVVPR